MDKMVLKNATIVTLFLFATGISKGQINLKAPVITKDSIYVNAPIQKVWASMYEINNWNKRYDFIINTHVEKSVEVNNYFRWQTTKLKLRSKILVVNKNSQLCWVGSKYGVKVFHNWVFIPIADNKTLLISEESQQGFFAVLFKKKFKESLKEGSMKWLNQIKKSTENDPRN